MILMASGSEVGIAAEAAKLLEEEGIAVRVVSMPCMDIFEEQDEEYRESVLPKNVKKRAAIEAGSSVCWGKYVGLEGIYITMDQFGASAPAKQLFEKYGFTAKNVTDKVKKMIS